MFLSISTRPEFVRLMLPLTGVNLLSNANWYARIESIGAQDQGHKKNLIQQKHIRRKKDVQI